MRKNILKLYQKLYQSRSFYLSKLTLTGLTLTTTLGVVTEIHAGAINSQPQSQTLADRNLSPGGVRPTEDKSVPYDRAPNQINTRPTSLDLKNSQVTDQHVEWLREALRQRAGGSERRSSDGNPPTQRDERGALASPEDSPENHRLRRLPTNHSPAQSSPN